MQNKLDCLPCVEADSRGNHYLKTSFVGWWDHKENEYQWSQGFFWLVGQGGYGIETSPAMGVAAASLIVEGRLPAAFPETGVTEADLSPERCVAR